MNSGHKIHHELGWIRDISEQGLHHVSWVWLGLGRDQYVGSHASTTRRGSLPNLD